MNRYIFPETVTSTNTFLLEGDYPDGTVCACLSQTAGRGRSGRQWETAPGNCLALSVLLQNMRGDKLMGAQIVAGYAVVEALMPWVDARLKWPNDLVYHGKKLAGMLIETKFAGNSLKKAVFGVGININAVAPALKDRAIALKEISPQADIPIEAFVEDCIALLEEKMASYLAGALDITAEWPLYSANYGKSVSIHINGHKTTVIETGITENGYLKAGSDVITEGEIGYDFSI